MRQHSSVRPPPWTPSDAGLNFHVCKKCGSITVQRTDSSDGFGAVWVLPSAAMALFRTDLPPNSVISYVLSEDFQSNRSVAQPLFQGYLGYVHDLSVHANSILVALSDSEGDLQRSQNLLMLLKAVLTEAIERWSVKRRDRVRCSVSNLSPVLPIAVGERGVVGDPERSVSLRLAAFEILELFRHPALWDTLSEDEMLRVEAAIDHAVILEQSRSAIAEALQHAGSQGGETLAAEAKFLYRVFRRRNARLSADFSLLIWECLRRLEPHVQPMNARAHFPTLAYERMRRLLEHQLLELGLLKVQTQSGDTSGRLIFQEPRTGRIFQIPRFEPMVEVYESNRAGRPRDVLHHWADVLRSL